MPANGVERSARRRALLCVELALSGKRLKATFPQERTKELNESIKAIVG